MPALCSQELQKLRIERIGKRHGGDVVVETFPDVKNNLIPRLRPHSKSQREHIEQICTDTGQ